MDDYEMRGAAIELEGTAPLMMEVHALRFERREGRAVDCPCPITPEGVAADYLQTDELGRPYIRWTQFLPGVIAGPGGKAPHELDVPDYGIGLEGGKLVVEGEWSPREVVRKDGLGKLYRSYRPVFDAWRASGVLRYAPSLWKTDEVRAAVEAWGAGPGCFRLVAWALAGEGAAHA